MTSIVATVACSFVSRPVYVLLSSYNGERFIGQQIASLLSQSFENFRIIIRDDGSTDSSRVLLEKAAVEDARINLIEDCKHIGTPASFYQLLRNAPDGGALYMFCDQDDVWRATKIERALVRIGSIDVPTLYCSRMLLTDSVLRVVSTSSLPRKLGFGNALVQNQITGCTVAINSAGRNFMLQQPCPPFPLHFDWWTYLVFSQFEMGMVVDNETTLYHRMHGENSTIFREDLLKDLRLRILRYHRSMLGPHISQVSASAVRVMTSGHNRALVDQLLARRTWRARLRLAASRSVWRHPWYEDVFLRITFLVHPGHSGLARETPTGGHPVARPGG